MKNKIRVLAVGVGHMGVSHAMAYHQNEGFELAGLVSRSIHENESLPEELQPYPRYSDFPEALTLVKPDAVSINSYTDTHEPFSLMALEAGAHVFVEKPLAVTVNGAQKVVDTAKRLNKKLVVGYILHHHPSWQKLIEVGQSLGKPLVMRMNLNQQSHGGFWETHKTLMQSQSPMVDCGVHYVDIMCQLTGSKPKKVHAVGVRLSNEIAADMYNYGQLQVQFEDGSVGWYEAGWGPMMSEVAFFVKDVVGPQGSISMVVKQDGETDMRSDDVDSHTKTNALLHHRSELDANNEFVTPDEFINMEDEPGHNELCYREQEFYLHAIQNDIDLSDHMQKAIDSLRIVLAADESIRTNSEVHL